MATKDFISTNLSDEINYFVIYKVIGGITNTHSNSLTPQIKGDVRVLYEECKLSEVKIGNSDILIDHDYMRSKYNIGISEEEIQMFMTHQCIWKKFLLSGQKFCLIIEGNVSFSASLKEIYNSICNLDEGWDVFFPYDKTTEEIDGKDILPYFLGNYWGSCAYFLSRTGAIKLLSINSIKQPLDDEILSLTLANDINTYYENTGWFTIAFDKSFVHIGRIREIEKTIKSYNAWSHQNRSRVQEILKVISDIAKRTNIELILHGGTLLGYVQHNQIIPWDDDVDLGIDENDFEKFVLAIKSNTQLQICEKTHTATNTIFYTIWAEEGEEIQGYPYKFPFVDIWLYNRKDDHMVFHNGEFFPNVFKCGLEPALFEQAQFFIPRNYIECLDTMYDEWKIKFVIYTWSHRLEKTQNKFFRTPIITDENGKFLGFKPF